MQCEYCKKLFKPGEDGWVHCPKCGAPREDKIKRKTEPNMQDPFYFAGFMIWPESFPMDRFVRYHVWLGEKRLTYFDLDRDTAFEYSITAGEGVSAEPLLDKLLRIAVSDSEVERYTISNYATEVKFEIRKLVRG